MNKEDLLDILEDIQHPAISYSLLKLGILTNVNFNNNLVSAVFAFPFPNIPIANRLIDSVKITLQNFEIEFDYSTRLMTEKEKELFLKLEHEAWRGL